MSFDVASFFVTLLAFVLGYFGLTHKVVSEGVSRLKPTRREVAIVSIALLSVSGSFVHDHYFQHQQIASHHFESWGPMPNLPESKFIVNTASLTNRSASYQLAVVSFINTSGDALDTPLQKSQLYDIIGDHVTAIVPWDPAFQQQLNAGYHPTSAALLVPKGLTMAQFSTLRQAIALGVIQIDAVMGP